MASFHFVVFKILQKEMIRKEKENKLWNESLWIPHDPLPSMLAWCKRKNIWAIYADPITYFVRHIEVAQCQIKSASAEVNIQSVPANG